MPPLPNNASPQEPNRVLLQLQQGASLNWRPHVEGAIKLIQLRGGFAALANKALEPQLVFLCSYVTSPRTSRATIYGSGLRG